MEQGTIVEYIIVHQAVTKNNGPVSQRPCVARCGRVAEQWALVPGAADHVCVNYDGVTLYYSTNIHNYIPLCTRHHMWMDRGTLWECKNGHPRTPENTYIHRNGDTECKICSRQAGARYYARKKMIKG